jgi:hypothetical protein
VVLGVLLPDLANERLVCGAVPVPVMQFWAIFQSTGLLGLALASGVQLAFGPKRFEEANQYLFLGLGIAATCGVFVFTLLPQQPPMTAEEKALEAGETVSLTGAGPGAAAPEMDMDGLRDRGSLNHRGGAGVKDAPSGGRAAKRTHSAGSAAEEPATGGATLMSTLELMCKRRQMLMMLPLIIYNGLSLGWFFAAYPVFYAPSKGPQLLPSNMVGFVQGTFYLSNTILSLTFGMIASRCGRRPVFYTAAVAAVTFLSLMLYLQSSAALPACEGETCSPVSYGVVFFLSFLFAMSDSVFESQVPAVLQSTTFFETEAERDAAQASESQRMRHDAWFSCSDTGAAALQGRDDALLPAVPRASFACLLADLRMWQSFGFAVQLAMNIFVTDDVIRLSVLLGWFVFAIICALSTDACVKPFDAKTTAPHRSVSLEGSEHLLS